MLADLVDDHPVLAASSVLLLVLLLLAAVRWWRKRRQARTAAPPLPPARTVPLPRPAPLPALSIDSFAPLPPRLAPRAPTPAPRPAEGGEAALLVVDDSAVARTLLRRLFEAAGYRVDLAADGDEALVLLDSARHAVLITDLEMPRIDGFALIAAVQARADCGDLPIIAITGYEELSARVQDMKGLYGIFPKPWDDAALLQRVSNLARLRRPAAVR